MPEDMRSHTFYRHYPKTEEEYFAQIEAFMLDLKTRHPDWFDENGNYRMRSGHERGHVSEERKAAQDKDHAQAFTRKLIASVSPAQRILLAAPPPKLRRHKRTTGFDPRHPALTERHADWVNVEAHSFCDTAAARGQSPQHASTLRSELFIVYLVNGQVPPWGAVDGRNRRPADYENVFAAVIASELFAAHEESLKAAEERGLFRSTVPRLSRDGEMLSRFYHATTVLKLGPATIGNYRAWLRVVGELVKACHAESQR